MMLTNHQEQRIASHMAALSMLFEGEASNRNRIQYSAAVGWDPAQVGERCRLTDAAGCDGVLAVFDPAAAAQAPVAVGVCVADGNMVRLELGSLWANKDGRAVLVTAHGRSHFVVEQGRFVEKPGQPARDLTRGAARARRLLAEQADQRRSIIDVVIAG